MKQQIIQKRGTELSGEELQQINDAIYREFKAQSLSLEHLQRKIFFLLKKNEAILAMGAVMKVAPVKFDQAVFTIYGVLNIIANEKGQGYGKAVVTAIKKYLLENDMTGIGFCMLKNKPFYEKCGFAVAEHATHQFVHKSDNGEIRNEDGQIIFYVDSSDQFMKKVLSQPNKEVILPTSGLW